MGKRKKRVPNQLLHLICLFVLSSCNGNLAELNTQNRIKLLDSWGEAEDVSSVEDGWLREMDSRNLAGYIDRALKENLELRQLAYSVRALKQKVISEGADLWPQLDLEVGRRDGGTLEFDSHAQTTSIGLDLSYELDLWGKLSAQNQAANLELLQLKSQYEQARQKLAVDVTQSWLDVIEAQKLLALYEKRVMNVEENREVIEASYKRGLENALDVYLVRNELNAEKARVSQQKAVLKRNVRTLERFWDGPAQGHLKVRDDIPKLKGEPKAGLPKDLIERSPELSATWNKLLSQNATLAFAHRQRLPSLTLGASLQENSSQVSKLFSSASTTAWSLLGGVVYPLFDAQKLKANEEFERLELKRLELEYLNQVYETFMKVSNTLAQEEALNEQYHHRLQAEEDAKNSAEISFDQYQKGLQPYTTVLESQKRSYEAQERVIQLKKQLVSNRIQLYLALGGSYTKKTEN